jgi:hypothetical protein
MTPIESVTSRVVRNLGHTSTYVDHGGDQVDGILSDVVSAVLEAAAHELEHGEWHGMAAEAAPYLRDWAGKLGAGERKWIYCADHGAAHDGPCPGLLETGP